MFCSTKYPPKLVFLMYVNCNFVMSRWLIIYCLQLGWHGNNIFFVNFCITYLNVGQVDDEGITASNEQTCLFFLPHSEQNFHTTTIWTEVIHDFSYWIILLDSHERIGSPTTWLTGTYIVLKYLFIRLGEMFLSAYKQHFLERA